jgi:hypothetical protein
MNRSYHSIRLFRGEGSYLKSSVSIEALLRV